MQKLDTVNDQFNTLTKRSVRELELVERGQADCQVVARKVEFASIIR